MQAQRLQRSQGLSRARAAPRARAVRCQAFKTLIVNTKGGGHAFIGYYLAKALSQKGHEVTIMVRDKRRFLHLADGLLGYRAAV